MLPRRLGHGGGLCDWGLGQTPEVYIVDLEPIPAPWVGVGVCELLR